MTQKHATRKTTKVVTVLATYVFKHISRVCFTVLSSDGVTHYNTCFTNGAASCTCPAHGECYHIRQLRVRAASKLAGRTPYSAVAEAAQIVAEVTAGSAEYAELATTKAVDNEFDPLVNAIRGGRLVEVRWSELTPDERREASANYFNVNNIA